MQKLLDLRTFVESIAGVTAKKLDAWTEDIELTLRGKHEGNGLTLLDMHYTAVIDIEDWPHDKRPVTLLFAHIISWLADYDCDRDTLDNKNPSVVPTIHDDSTADIEISIEFKESVTVVEDPQGEIDAFGKCWSLADVPIDIAESGTVTEAQSTTNTP